MPELDRLREVGEIVRQPSFDELLETRRRRTQRARIMTGATLALTTTVAVGALFTAGDNLRTDPPPVEPPPTPTFEIPAGQQTITPEIRPGDVSGFEVLATVTNTQPAHRNDTYLETTVTGHVDTEQIVYDCRAHDIPTWFAFASGDLVSDSPGGATDGWSYRECKSAGRLSLALDGDIPESTFRMGTEQKTVRMFATAPPSAELQACLDDPPPEGCTMVPEPLATTDAEFGFRIYEHAPARLVLALLEADNGEPYQFEALSRVDGRAWLLDHAVVSAPDSDRLAVELPASYDEYLVDVYPSRGPHFDRCLKQHAGDLPDWETTDHLVYEAAVDQACGVDLRLVVDGVPVDPVEDPSAHGHFMELGAHLDAGAVHRVEVEVVRGDPRDIRYAIVVRNRTEMP